MARRVAIIPILILLCNSPSALPDASEVAGEPEVFATGLKQPFGLAFDSNGNLFCTDQGSKGLGRVSKFLPSGSREIVVDFPEGSSFKNLGAIAVLGETIAMINYASGELYTISLDGKEVGTTRHTGLSELSFYDESSKTFVPKVIAALVADPEENLIYVASQRSEWPKDRFYHSPKESFVVIRFREGLWSNWETVLETDKESCTAMAVANTGHMFLALQGGIFSLDPANAKSLSIFKARDTLPGAEIGGMAVDSRGNLYVADKAPSGAVYKVSKDGGTTVRFVASLRRPAGIVIRADHLYVAEATRGRILRVKLSGAK